MNEVPTLTLLDSVCKMISDLSTSIEKMPSSNWTLPLSGSLNVGIFLGPRTVSSNRQTRIASTSKTADNIFVRLVKHSATSEFNSIAYLSGRRLLQFYL